MASWESLSRCARSGGMRLITFAAWSVGVVRCWMCAGVTERSCGTRWKPLTGTAPCPSLCVVPLCRPSVLPLCVLLFCRLMTQPRGYKSCCHTNLWPHDGTPPLRPPSVSQANVREAARDYKKLTAVTKELAQQEAELESRGYQVGAAWGGWVMRVCVGGAW